MFTVDQEERIKTMASKRDLNFNLRMLSRAGAYQTLTTLSLAEKPFEQELRERTVHTITSSILQGLAVIYALGAGDRASQIADDLLGKWTEGANV